MLTFMELTCIEADAADVVEVLRSSEPVPLEKGNNAFSAQAYLAVIKQENRQVVYSAVHVRELQRSVIYTVEGDANIDAARKSGEEFLAGIGFRLESVSLKFSPAMREVILREIPVIQAPEAARKVRREKAKQLAEWRRLVDEEVNESAGGEELSLAEWTQAKRKQDELAAARKKAAEQLAAEERNAGRFAVLREIVDGCLQQNTTGEMVAIERTAREQLQSMLSAAQAATAESQAKIRRLEAELAAEKAERSLAVKEKTLTGALLAECRQQLAQAEHARERAIEERQAGELARKDAENRLRSLYEIAQKMKEQLTAGGADRARLLAEKDAAERQVLQLRDEAQKAGERFQAEVARHQKSRGELLEKLALAEDELRQGRALLARGEAERARLAQIVAEAADGNNAGIPTSTEVPELGARIERLQRDLLEQSEKERLLRSEVDRLSAERTDLQKRLAESGTDSHRKSPRESSEKERLRSEVDRLLAEKTELQKRLAEIEADPQRQTPMVAPARAANSELPGKLPTEPPPHVARRPPAADAFFHVDWDLTGVPYGAPEEICEVRKTMNRVRLSLEGYPDQYCSACLIIAQNGDRKKVFIAFRLSVSNRVLVYVPVNPTDTPAAFTKAVKEAEKFVQVVGLDLENVPLSKNPRQRAKTLESISFFSHPPMNAGNF